MADLGLDRGLRVVFYDSATDNQPNQQDHTVFELQTLLLEPEVVDCNPCPGKKCPHKNGLSWSAGFIPAGKTRKTSNVESLDLAVFDLDHLTRIELEGLCGRLEGFELLLHTTHTHQWKAPSNLPSVPKPASNNTDTDTDNNNVRLIFPLTRSITPKEWERIWGVIVRKFDFPQSKGRGVDPKAKDPSRLFFLPRVPRGAEVINEYQPGQRLDPDVLLLENLAHSKLVKAQRPDQPQVDPDSVDLKDLKGFLRRYNPDDDFDGVKRELIRRVLAEEPLADKPGCTEVKFEGPEVYGRDDAVFRTAKILGWKLPVTTPVEAAMELLRPSISKIPTYADDDATKEGFEAWMIKAAKNFEVGVEEQIAKRIENSEGRNGVIELAQRKAARSTGASPPTSLRPASDPPTSSGVAADDPSELNEAGKWRLDLMVRTDKKGVSTPTNNSLNATIILENHPAWKSVLRFNEVTKNIECHQEHIKCVANATPGEVKTGATDKQLLSKDKQRPEQLLTAIDDWLQRWEGIEINGNKLGDRILGVARAQSYDPLKNYLLGLKWDGIARMESWLEAYCGARLTNDTEEDLTWYVRNVSWKWLTAAVARALDPGCQADNVIIFEGEQGIRKSTMLRTLGGEFFTDSLRDLSNKDSRMLVAQNWIVEMPELASIRSVDTEQMKAFFSARDDQFRAPYAARIELFLRRCVFAGTTNDDTYLGDITGNRRYWPIVCQWFDLQKFRRDRDQILAEAVARFHAGGEACEHCAHDPDRRCAVHRWWFTADENKQWVEKITNERLHGGSEVETLLSWWDKTDSNLRLLELTMTEVAEMAFEIPKHQIESKCRQIGRALKKAGFSRRKKREGTRTFWVYEATPELLARPKKPLTRLHLVNNVAAADGTEK